MLILRTCCRRITLAISFGAWLATSAGCGSNEAIQVHGTVTLSGEPVSNAAVLFVADSGGRPAVGTTNEQGKYSVQLRSSDGPPAGRYYVSITAVDAPDAATDNFDTAAAEVMAELRRPRQRPRWRTPPRYANPKTSGLYYEVDAGADHVADFDLKR